MVNEKVLAYTRLSEQASKQITSSYQEWTSFLAMTGKLYKYPFPEQLMIFAQRPDATACADYDLWNKRMRRYVRRGSKGIALIDNSSGTSRLRYVFDVSDTGAKENARSPHFWQYRPEQEDTVTAALENRFGVSGRSGLAAQLGQIAGQLAEDYWNDNQYDILHTVDGSFLEEYDEFNIGVQFKSAATVSIAYTLYSRCGLEPENYFEHEDFLAIFDFNTPQALSALGMAVSQSNEQVLRQLEVTIKRYERDKLTERSAEHGEQPDLHENRGLSAPEPDAGGTAREGAGQIREDAPDVSEGTPSRIVEFPVGERETDGTLSGDRGRGGEPDGTADAPAGESGGRNGAAESGRHDDLGGADEQLPGAGGGNHPDGAGVQLTDTEPPQPNGRFSQDSASGQLTFNFIPSEQEQIARIEEAERAQAPSASSISQEDIDAELQSGRGFDGGKLKIYELYQQGLSTKDTIAALKQGYYWTGHGHTLPDGSTAYVDYSPSMGMKMHHYDTQEEVKASWTQIEQKLRQMIAEGRYLTPEELKQYESSHPGTPEKGQAEPDAALEHGTQAESREPEMGAAPVQEPERPAIHPAPSPAPREITQADIDTALQEWNGDMASKRRVQQHMESHARDKGTADWLKNEYGDSLPAFPVTVNGTAADLPWTKVQRHLARLVKEDRFFTPEELDNFADIDTEAVRQQLEQGGDSPFIEQAGSDAGQLAGEGQAPGHRFSIATITDDNSYAAPGGKFALWDDQLEDYHMGEDSLIPTFLTQQRAEAYLAALEREAALGPSPTVRELYGYYKPVVENLVKGDTAYQNACKNSDRENAMLEGNRAIERAIPYINDLEFVRLYYDLSSFHNQLHREVLDETYPQMSQTEQAPDLSGQAITREGDTITIGDGTATHQTDITVTDEEWEQIKEALPDAAPAHDPLAPAYQVGDTVYLENTAFEITEIGLYDVQLRDPSLSYPILRTEGKERLEQMLRLDSRNGHITEYLPARLDRTNEDFREVLASHLLTDQDKAYISGWLRSGEGNTKIAQRLSEQFAGRAEAVELETGDTADYFTSTVSMDVEIHDRFGTKQSMAWTDIAPVLRAMYQQELDGLTHELQPQAAERLTGRPSYQVGDHVTLPGHDHEITGEISWIGETEVTIKTGPYAWSHELVGREQFEEMLRQDERNAGLFTPEEPAQETSGPQPRSADEPAPAPGTATLYPGDKNGLPYDVVIEPLHFPEQEPARDTDGPAQAAPASENYHITDDQLGVGGPKEKFRRNMEAISTLHRIESEGRTATLEEQAILSQYVGWGGLPDAFDETKASWANEFRELYAALSPEEYEAAKASTLNAHYTSPTVIKAVYEAVGRMGFKAGNILEPSCGVGNFFGMLPEGMSASRLYGVELDSITGRIARQLYPQAQIEVGGYEKAGFPKDFFDLAIGNVPYGQYQVNDPEYNRLGFSIHNYFFAKALDQVRPGGVVAFLTSRYTLDSKDTEVRRYLAQRADLLGAIRLPNNAFKANAGTEVVSDIIFLQKRDTPAIEDPAWVRTGENADGFAINRYFIDHPEMVLGRQAAESTQYGRPDFTVEPIQGLLLADQLHDVVKYIRGEYREAAPPQLDPADITEPVTMPADPAVKNYSFAIVDGEVYYRENSIMVKAQLNASAKERVKGMAALRDCVRGLIDLQLDEYTPDSAIKEKQAELDALYDTFSAQYGLINDRANRLAFSKDSSYYLLCALEVLDEDGRLERKADMFTKRTIRPHKDLTHVDTASEALAVSIGERAKVDLPYMAQLTGKTEDALIADLRGVIFKDPAAGDGPLTGWQTADEYLSGNVRKKLREAERAAKRDPAFAPNVEALKLAQPKDLDASEIEVRLGATWIDKRYVQQFMYETLRTPFYLQRNIKVHYSPITAEWSITAKNSIPHNDVAAYTTYGTDRANAYRILEDSLNLRDVRIYDTIEDADGKEKRVLNAKETTLAAQKQQALRDAFRDWIWKDPDRRQALVQQYNEEMNSIRPREYDGSHIVFSGINPEIRLQPHQVNAIAHVLYGGNTLLAHEVGAGKTFEMIAAAMESKRLGLCQKSIFVVPNHLTEQTASEFLRLYPSANILVTTKRDFETHNRKKFCARISTGDYDAVIIGHSQFEKIPISMERQERLLQQQIDEITEGIREVQYSGGERFTVKQLERTKKGLEARLEKLQANHRKDDVVTFEQLGVDRMFVDESDNYKNLFLYTKMRNVAGLSTTDAQKSSDMFAKCRYLDEITGGRGIVFATGTPISNSMTEMYTIQRYLQFDRLQEMGMNHFDCWASRFGETTTALELAPEGTGYRARTRFAKFFNLPELMNIFKEVADIKTADQLNLPTPEVEYHTIAAKPTEIQQEMVKELSERAEKVHNGIDPRIDNMLKITSDGRKLGLDQRTINPLLPDEEGTKVNRCVESVLTFWRDGDDKKLTQLVFCDISTPKAVPSKKTASAKLDDPELHALEAAIPLEPEKPFTIYEDIRQKLIAGGMPPEQIAFIHDANTDVQKKELFAKVRSGQVRVLIGSTQKMGAGTNVQDKLIALHDLDCPWRPRDLIQRKGRIERRGNENPLVHVCRYVTEGTFDAYLWQTVENKQKFISQIMTSKSPVRSCEDVDEAALSFAEIKALCAGDPRIKERMELDVEVSRLKIMKADHQSKQFRMEDNVLKHFPEQISQNEGYIAGLKADMQTLAEHPHPIVTVTKEKEADGKGPEEPDTAGQTAEPPADAPAAAVEVKQGFAGMVIKGMEFTDKAEAGAALLDACKEIKGTEPVEIGSYRGFPMMVSVEGFGSSVILTLKGQMSHRAELGKDTLGNLARIDHALSKMPERLEAVETQLGNLREQLEAARAEMGKPFPMEAELKEKSARLAELDSLLNIGGGPPVQEQVIAKSARPSVLDSLKRPLPPRQKAETERPKKHTQER